MKKLFLFISLWGIFGSELFSPSVLLASESTVNNETISRDEETVFLHGLFAIGKMRSLVCPFEVTKSSSFITIHYLVSLSDICVGIIDEYGQEVYLDVIDPIANTQLLIDISDWGTGDYILYFMDSFGNRIYGTFEISD